MTLKVGTHYTRIHGPCLRVVWTGAHKHGLSIRP